MWEELVSVLQSLLAAYEEICKLGGEKRLALRAVAVKDLEKIVRREQALAEKIGRLEVKRRGVCQRIAAENHCAADKLSAAIALCGGAVKEELKRLHDKLNEALREFAVLNKENSALTRQSLELMNYKINILAETKVEPTYAGGGRENVTAAKLLDYKA